MADKGKKGKGAAAAPAAPAPTTATPPPSKSKEDNAEEEKEKKPTKSEQPKDEVGTRKGCRRYMWEFKDSNRQFWVMGHAVVKLFSVVNGPGIPAQGPKDKEREKWAPGGLRGAPELVRALCHGSGACFPAGLPHSCDDHVHGDLCAPSPDAHRHHGDIHLLLLLRCLHPRHSEILAFHPMARICK